MEVKKKIGVDSEGHSLNHVLQIFHYDPTFSDGTGVDEIPIYNVALNRKNSCFPFSVVINKDGTEEKIAKCRSYPNIQNCHKCVTLKKDLRGASKRINAA